MKLKSPASGKRQGLDNNFDESNSSIKTFRKPSVTNHLSTPQYIAEKWVDRCCYHTIDRALRALVGGDL
jgi:hypothetical protein